MLKESKCIVKKCIVKNEECCKHFFLCQEKTQCQQIFVLVGKAAKNCQCWQKAYCINSQCQQKVCFKQLLMLTESIAKTILHVSRKHNAGDFYCNHKIQCKQFFMLDEDNARNFLNWQKHENKSYNCKKTV